MIRLAAICFALAALPVVIALALAFLRDPDCHAIPPPPGCIQSLHSICDSSCHRPAARDDWQVR